MPFIGAGVSQLGGSPGWNEFANLALKFFVTHDGRLIPLKSSFLTATKSLQSYSVHSYRHGRRFKDPETSSPQPTDITKKPIDSSARNPFIYIEVVGVPSGLRPATGGEGRRENTQTESKPRRLLTEMAPSVVRKSPQEPSQTRGSRQKKANWLGLAFKVLVVGRNHCANSLRVAPAGLI